MILGSQEPFLPPEALWDEPVQEKADEFAVRRRDLLAHDDSLSSYRLEPCRTADGVVSVRKTGSRPRAGPGRHLVRVALRVERR